MEALAAASETDLRENGFGYRAKYIAKAAKHIAMRSKEVELSGEVLGVLQCVGAVDAPSAAWLYALRGNGDTDVVREALKELSGVGPKVADCIALFALDQLDLIPVGMASHVFGHAIMSSYSPHTRHACATDS